MLSRDVQTVFFQDLGDLLGGNFFSLARGVSDDGTTVVGFSETPLIPKQKLLFSEKLKRRV